MSTEAPRRIFVDASGWIALVNRGDGLHSRATHIYRDRLKRGGCFVMTSAVLLEVGNWLSPSSLRNLAIDLVEQIERSALIDVVHVTPEFYRKGWQLYGSRTDKDWGIVDCISFVVMSEGGMTDALTGDHHFEQAGFVKLL